MTAASATYRAMLCGTRRRQDQDGDQRRIGPWVLKIIVGGYPLDSPNRNLWAVNCPVSSTYWGPLSEADTHLIVLSA